MWWVCATAAAARIVQRNKATGAATKAPIIAVNEPRTLKVIIPQLSAMQEYTLRIVTQTSSKSHGTLLTVPRVMESDFAMTTVN